jgi:multimeric flavodoxin WrbA
MKALLISASPHKEESSSFLLAKEVLRGLAEGGITCESLHLADFEMSFCRHCELCHKKIMQCSIKDEVYVILRKMLEADGIVLASPNYINQVTAAMKTLFDRSTHFIHCKRLLGKYTAGVVSSGSGQNQAVLDYIGYYSNICGAQYSGGISALQQFGGEKKEEAAELGRKMAAEMQAQKKYPQQLKIIEEGRDYFSWIIKLRKDDWLQEYTYWVEKGWLKE